MAKNIGIIKFTGKLGGLSGRDTPFGIVIQTPGGFKSERVKNDPIYDLTRKRNSEFGHCATLASLFHRNLLFYLKLLPDSYPYNHIQQWMVAVKECDPSPKGEKTVGKGLLTDAGAALFRKFSFNRKRRFGFADFPQHRVDLENGIVHLAPIDTSRMTFLTGAKAIGWQLILMRVDFGKAECVVNCSDTVVVEKGVVASPFLEAGVPDGDGVLVGVLFMGFRGGSGVW